MTTYSRLRYWRDRERILAARKRYYRRNKAKIKARHQTAAYRAQRRAYMRAYRLCEKILNAYWFRLAKAA